MGLTDPSSNGINLITLPVAKVPETLRAREEKVSTLLFSTCVISNAAPWALAKICDIGGNVLCNLIDELDTLSLLK